MNNRVSIIYLAASSRDARLTRICVASIRYFYPDITIKILPGDYLQPFLKYELKKLWNVDVASIPEKDYGWGYVKLEPLFFEQAHYFLVIDVDTVFTGKILDLFNFCNADFLVDNEFHSFENYRKLYYCPECVREIYPNLNFDFLPFSGGQWFGKSGIFKRQDFENWIIWTFPRIQKHSNCFFGGEQGVLSLVFNIKEFYGLNVMRNNLMLWPGNATLLQEISVHDIRNFNAKPFIIHWAGLKNVFLNKMPGSDILFFFENLYFSKFKFPSVAKNFFFLIHIFISFFYVLKLNLKLFIKKHFLPF
jgi:hypothetical protein